LTKKQKQWLISGAIVAAGLVIGGVNRDPIGIVIGAALAVVGIIFALWFEINDVSDRLSKALEDTTRRIESTEKSLSGTLKAVTECIESTEKNLSGRIADAELHFSQRVHGIDFDPQMVSYQDTARHFIGPPQSGVNFVMHTWLLGKAKQIVTTGFYKEVFSDDFQSDEETRIGVLAAVLRNAESYVYACTYADSDHIRFFWGKSAAIDDYIHAHGEAIRRQRTKHFDLRRIFIIHRPLPNEDVKRLGQIIDELRRQEMTDNYWIPEDDARSLFTGRSKTTFPDRSFFLADDAFLSEGKAGKAGAPHLTFTKHLEHLRLVKEQFELLQRAAVNNRLNSQDELDRLLAYLRTVGDAAASPS
jgi:hypothetical protein